MKSRSTHNTATIELLAVFFATSLSSGVLVLMKAEKARASPRGDTTGRCAQFTFAGQR
jgi:hypothetical protein